ncbi:MAG: hypothetical protein ACRDBM_04490, partial [Sporomusa sp.]
MKNFCFRRTESSWLLEAGKAETVEGIKIHIALFSLFIIFGVYIATIFIQIHERGADLEQRINGLSAFWKMILFTNSESLKETV